MPSETEDLLVSRKEIVVVFSRVVLPLFLSRHPTEFALDYYLVDHVNAIDSSAQMWMSLLDSILVIQELDDQCHLLAVCLQVFLQGLVPLAPHMDS